MSEKASFYYCKTCKINFETLKCPRCGRKGTPANPPFERDFSNDPSYFDYVLKNDRDKESKD